MRIGNLYRDGHFGLSIEIFPPKTPEGDAALFENLERLSVYRPVFVSCTYGAGGSTQTRTLDLCAEIRRRFRLGTTAHLTCVGSTQHEIRQWLGFAAEKGIGNIMALRGDPPKGQENFQQVSGGFRNAHELVSLIRAEFPDLGVGVAGYPEKHPEAPDLETDLAYLRQKVVAGADAVFTQLFFVNDSFLRFRDRCGQLGIRVPLIPGIMPVTNFAQIKRITSMCGAALPERLASRLEQAQEDAQAQFDIGVEYAIEQCRELMAEGVAGIHFYVLNRSQACEAILEALHYRPPMQQVA